MIIHDRVPEVRGTTYFGSQVVATWRSLVLTSSLIADSNAGEFSIRSPEPLEIGKHTVTLYAITPDGIRSPDLTIPFEICEESFHETAADSMIDLVKEYGMFTKFIWLPIILAILTYWFILFYKRRKKKEEKKQ